MPSQDEKTIQAVNHQPFHCLKFPKIPLKGEEGLDFLVIKKKKEDLMAHNYSCCTGTLIRDAQVYVAAGTPCWERHPSLWDPGLIWGRGNGVARS